jgi:HK97 gp10 family phage protein
VADEVHVKGLKDLQKFLDQLTPKMEANIMRGALRAGMNVVKPVAAANIHPVSGLLAAGLKIFTRIRGGVVSASLRATGKHAFVARWVEFGTRAHDIVAKLGGSLFFGGVFTKVVNHPGARPKPFMRPALDGQAQAAVIAAGNYIKDRLAKKEGLDTSHVMVEGDE